MAAYVREQRLAVGTSTLTSWLLRVRSDNAAAAVARVDLVLVTCMLAVTAGRVERDGFVTTGRRATADGVRAIRALEARVRCGAMVDALRRQIPCLDGGSRARVSTRTRAAFGRTRLRHRRTGTRLTRRGSTALACVNPLRRADA